MRRAAPVWNQRQVRTGQITSGFWAVDVKEAGRYQIELRRWPEETGYALAAGIEGDDSGWYRAGIQPKNAASLRGRRRPSPSAGHSYPSAAKISSKKSIPPRRAACFEIELAAGLDRLYASFYDRIERTIAPYYVYVRKLSG